MKKNILFIAPITPPVHGQAKISEFLLNLFSEKNSVIVINLSKKSLRSGVISIKRGMKIISILYRVWLNYKASDFIFLSIAESFLGNIRDIFILAIIRKKAACVFVHMQGGEEMTLRLNGPFLLKKINYFLFSRIGGVIVEGQKNFNLFTSVLPKQKIHVIPNFSEEYLFISQIEMEKKFTEIQKIQILFLSNFNEGKGYMELLEGYMNLNAEIKAQIKLVYVGEFESQKDEIYFLKKISFLENVEYKGVLTNELKKQEILHQSHIFCLPTYYPYEGQPISILESYAAGCFVITTNHADIPAIFENGVNGYFVEQQSSLSISDAITRIFNKKGDLQKVAYQNREIANNKYRKAIFEQKIHETLKDFITFN